MTLQELNRNFELHVRLKKAKEMLQSLWDAAHPRGQVLTGMPHAPGVKDKVGDLAIEIADLEERISYMEREMACREQQISGFIQSIEDDYLRTLSWKDVAAIVGGHNTEASVKSACYRYLSE